MLTDEELEQPVEGAHGWSGRDLMGHLLTWQLLSLDVAKELALGEHRGGPPGVRPRRRRAARLPDRRARDALAQERRPAALLLRGDDRALRRPRGGSGGHPRGRGTGVTEGAGPRPDGDAAGEPVSDLTLADVLAAAAEDLDGVIAATGDTGTSWSLAGRPFAALAGGRAEFQLDPLVAGAALRTPDTAPSARGGDWVAFAPDALDDPAVDRAEAWFLSAYRRAAGAL